MRSRLILACLAFTAVAVARADTTILKVDNSQNLDGRSSGCALPGGDQLLVWETSDGPTTYERLLRSVVHLGQPSVPVGLDYSPLGHYVGEPTAVMMGGRAFLYFLICTDLGARPTVYRCPVRADGGLALLEKLDPVSGLNRLNDSPRFCAYSGGVAVGMQSNGCPCVAVSPDGLHFGPPYQVEPDGGEAVAVGALARGLVCAYQSGARIFARTSDDAAQWSRPTRVSEGRDPSLLTRLDGGVDLYYTVAGALVRRSLSTAGELGREERLADKASRPSPLRLSDGRIMLSFVSGHQLNALTLNRDAP